ncbi:unnamed protein product, partial [Prorocentrum cordatum]
GGAHCKMLCAAESPTRYSSAARRASGRVLGRQRARVHRCPSARRGRCGDTGLPAELNEPSQPTSMQVLHDAAPRKSGLACSRYPHGSSPRARGSHSPVEACAALSPAAAAHASRACRGRVARARAGSIHRPLSRMLGGTTLGGPGASLPSPPRRATARGGRLHPRGCSRVEGSTRTRAKQKDSIVEARFGSEHARARGQERARANGRELELHRAGAPAAARGSVEPCHVARRAGRHSPEPGPLGLRIRGGEERPSRRTRASPFRRRRAEGRSEAGLPRRRRGGSEAHATDSCPPWARRRHRHARVHACTRALRPPRGVVGAAARPVWGRERAGLDLRGWPTRRQKRHTTSELRVHRRRSGGAYDLCHSLLVRAARRPNRPQPGAEPAGRLPSHKCWRPTSCARCSKRASPGLGG